MNKYEILYVVSTKLEEEKREELITRFANLVTDAGGEAEVSKWGIKKLAYPIKFQNEGFYVQMNFTAPEELPLELERQLRLLDGILRFMTVKKIENKLTIKAAAKKEAIRIAKAEALAKEEAAKAEALAKEEAAKAEAAKNESAKAEKKAEKAADKTEAEAVAVSEVVAVPEAETAADAAADAEADPAGKDA